MKNPAGTGASRSDAAWLSGLCAARVGFAMTFTAYAGVLPLLKTEWGLSAGEAGLVQSAWHAGYLVSLFAVGFLAERFGAKRTFSSRAMCSRPPPRWPSRGSRAIFGPRCCCTGCSGCRREAPTRLRSR